MGGRVEQISEAVEPVVAALGIELYDIELLGSGPQQVLRVKIDREGGVDLDTVTEATRAISPVVDELVDGRFTLEVSSPGIERDLRRPVHFQRAVGSVVKVKAHGADGPIRVKGTLVEADDTGFVIKTNDDDEPHRITYADATSARTVFEWESQQ